MVCRSQSAAVLLSLALLACSDDSTSATPGDTSNDPAADVPSDAMAEGGGDAVDGEVDVDALDGSESDAGDGAGECPTPDPFWTDVALDAFDPIPDLASLDFDAVTPAESTDYWELRFVFEDEADVVGSSGTKCTEAASPTDCEAAFDALSADSGFGGDCGPAQCHFYLAVNRGDDNTVVTDVSSVVDFLAPIDVAEEAVLVAHAQGFNWIPPDPTAAGVRAVADGFELLLTELTQTCLPVQTDRVLVRVSTEGELQILRRQVYNAICEACI